VTARWLAGLAAAFVVVASGCGREPTRTVVPSGAGEARPAAGTMGAPAASGGAPGPLLAAVSPQPRLAAEQPSGPAPAPAASGDGAALLASRQLVVPVAGVPPAALADMFDDARGARRHEAIDILAPRGTKVFAVDDGTVAKLFTSKPGGLTVYQFDPQGQLAYYYAHLDRYASGLAQGTTLRRGDLVGYVGTTGNAGNTPHLHFAVFRLGPERRWWEGEPVNPYPALRRAQPAG